MRWWIVLLLLAGGSWTDPADGQDAASQDAVEPDAAGSRESTRPVEDGGRRLRAAARRGDAAAIRRLIDAGVDVDAANRYRLTAVYYAADRGHVDCIDVLLEAGASVEIENEPFYRLSPMIMAARKNHVGVVRRLLEADARCGSWTATWPATLGHSEVVEVLVGSRPDIFVGDALDRLAGIAASTGNDRLLKFLCDRGAKIDDSPADLSAEFEDLSDEQKRSLEGAYQIRVWSPPPR